uniref:Selenoprotein W n=1 Tax=Pseudonaja textilis TaxID=8673 RepID=A0A670ZY18_PSETE
MRSVCDTPRSYKAVQELAEYDGYITTFSFDFSELYNFLLFYLFGEGTPQVTGWFEVMVAGKMVHSKKNGDGFVDNNAKLNKIIEAIKTALA